MGVHEGLFGGSGGREGAVQGDWFLFISVWADWHGGVDWGGDCFGVVDRRYMK